MKFIILLLIVGYFSSYISCQKSFSPLPCIKSKRGPRIVGGQNSEKGDTPYIVSLTRRGGHFCGATILNDKWLLTAAHCLCDGFDQILKASHIRGVLGLHNISEYKKNFITNNIDQPFEVDFKNIIVHPEYNCNKVSNDIALLEIRIPISFTEFIQPACVATDEDNEESYEDALATVSGWGWTNEDQEVGKRPDILQKASVKVWNNDKCQQSFSLFGKNYAISKTQMCAGFKDGGIDSCWADSGGPLVTENNILIGIVSTGVGCARPGLPGIYTRVTKYTKWMETVVLT